MLTDLTGSKRLRDMAAEMAALRILLDQTQAQVAGLEAMLSGRISALEMARDAANTQVEQAGSRLDATDAGFVALGQTQADLDRQLDALADRANAHHDTQQRHDRAINRLERRLDAHAEDARTTATGLIERIDAVRHAARAD